MVSRSASPPGLWSERGGERRPPGARRTPGLVADEFRHCTRYRGRGVGGARGRSRNPPWSASPRALRIAAGACIPPSAKPPRRARARATHKTRRAASRQRRAPYRLCVELRGGVLSSAVRLRRAWMCCRRATSRHCRGPGASPPGDGGHRRARRAGSRCPHPRSLRRLRPAPIAAASLAQVHQARLADGSR